MCIVAVLVEHCEVLMVSKMVFVKISLTSVRGQNVFMENHYVFALHGIGRSDIVLMCSQNSAVSKIHQEQLVRNVLLVDAQSINSSFWARTFCHLTSVYQLKKYEYPQLAPVVSASSPISLHILMLCRHTISDILLCVAGAER